jgi:16S rRNA (guanine(966)-N(2))-methyltransferase RsmD
LPDLLRVAAGEARGRRLKTPKGIRPTQGIVKEAIFNILGHAVLDALVLDLFAGSGALGIEALSRGAEQATFVERDASTAAILRQNLEVLGYADRARIVRADVVRWLETDPEQAQKATLALLDPPYRDAALVPALAELERLLPAGAMVVVEHARGEAPPPLSRLGEARTRRYGDTEVTVLRMA